MEVSEEMPFLVLAFPYIKIFSIVAARNKSLPLQPPNQKSPKCLRPSCIRSYESFMRQKSKMNKKVSQAHNLNCLRGLVLCHQMSPNRFNFGPRLAGTAWLELNSMRLHSKVILHSGI